MWCTRMQTRQHTRVKALFECGTVGDLACARANWIDENNCSVPHTWALVGKGLRNARRCSGLKQKTTLKGTTNRCAKIGRFNTSQDNKKTFLRVPLRFSWDIFDTVSTSNDTKSSRLRSGTCSRRLIPLLGEFGGKQKWWCVSSREYPQRENSSWAVNINK